MWYINEKILFKTTNTIQNNSKCVEIRLAQFELILNIVGLMNQCEYKVVNCDINSLVIFWMSNLAFMSSKNYYKII